MLTRIHHSGLLAFALISSLAMTACAGNLPFHSPNTAQPSQLNPHHQPHHKQPHHSQHHSKKEHYSMNTTKTITSRHEFDDTVTRLQSAFKDKGMTIFAVIDHQQAAKQANLDMQPATVIIFGTPKAGTPLMKKDPNFALQLPLKVLVTEVDRQVNVSFEDTHSLIANSDISFDEVKDTLANAEKLIEKTVTQ